MPAATHDIATSPMGIPMPTGMLDHNSIRLGRAVISNNSARTAMIQSLLVGLTSKRAVRPDLWAETYRIMGKPFPGPFTFDWHPWTREMLNDNSEECVGQKAAQMGFTESVGINRAFFTIDQLKQDVLYVLPTKTPDATDFSSGRFDPALERSPYLAQLFTNVNNVSLKRAGANSLYVRGSRARNALKSLPVGLIILDEEDEFDQEAIILVRERISGQIEGSRQIWHISTPSIPGNGVNVVFERSSKAHFFFRCPMCSRHIELVYPDSYTEAGYICTQCKQVIAENDKMSAIRQGEWVHAHPSKIHGYQVNQMYSPPQIISHAKFKDSVELSYTNAAEEQEFHNSKLGEAHIVSGYNVTSEHIEMCTKPYKMREHIGGIITMGVDVGGELHVEIDQWHEHKSDSIDINDNMYPKLIFADTIKDFDDIDNLIYLFRPAMVIIDEMPDTRKALTVAQRYPGRVKLCHYGGQLNITVYEDRVSVNRTAWLDRSLGRIINRVMDIPMDTPDLWKQHVQHLVRRPLKDKNGNIIHQYVKTGDDHYAHARNYAEIGLACLEGGENQRMVDRKI